MKIKVQPNKEFQPLTVTITLESLKEAAALWLRSNLEMTSIVKENLEGTSELESVRRVVALLGDPSNDEVNLVDWNLFCVLDDVLSAHVYNKGEA